MAAHPLLLDTSTPAPQSKKDRYKPMQPKFASIRANARNVPTPPPTLPPAPTVAKENPYAAAAASASAEPGFEGTPRERVGRSLRFNPKGKYVSIANQIRQDSQLEALKQRIAESARKAGLDGEFDTLEKNIRVRWFQLLMLLRNLLIDVTCCSVKLLPLLNGGMHRSFRLAAIPIWMSLTRRISRLGRRTRQLLYIFNIQSPSPRLEIRTSRHRSHSC
jgi:hypothetical protein